MGAWIEICRLYSLVHERGSHPTWVRGLKSIVLRINISIGKSHPTWVRGLKYKRLPVFVSQFVAPHVGAWIEIIQPLDTDAPELVAPHVGAWIEISCANTKAVVRASSHPTWVRGLKCRNDELLGQQLAGRTPRGCVD